MQQFSKEDINNILKNFKIKAECDNISVIDNIINYDLKLNEDGRLNKLYNLTDELALKFKSKPLIKLMPQIGCVRMQFAYDNRHKVYYKDIISKYEDVYKTNKEMSCLFGINVDDGTDLWVDLMNLPHMLIAGTTGSGKSSFLNLLIKNILDSNKRNNIQLFILDPKIVDFSKYTKVSNCNVFNNYSQAIDVLKYLNSEMDRRYREMSKNLLGIDNKKYLLVIDEGATFLLNKSSEFSDLLNRLSQKCRAAGIHIILTVHRPSVDVVTGTLKNNFPSRVSFKLPSKIDSSIILDASGAESLIGNGDGLFKDAQSNLIRFQAALPD